MRRKYRLRANADFQRIRRTGRTYAHRLLVIAVLPNGLEYSRFGFAVGRRIGKAVLRNRIKRRMRELVRERIQRGEVAEGWDVVFIARHPIRDATYPQINEAMGFLLYRARLVSEAE